MAKASHQTLIQWELEKIKKQKGEMQAKDVVDFARNNPRSALHKEFEWDDSIAAEQHRISQARHIIKVNVIMLPSADNKTRAVVPQYISVPSESGGRGYEDVSAILRKQDKRAELLTYTIKRLLAIKEARLFPELLAVVKEIDKAANQHLEDDKAA